MEQPTSSATNNNSFIKYLEVVGLCFLLIAFGWETFERKADDISNTGEWYIVNQKLDQVWGAEKALCETVRCDQYKGSISIDFNSWPQWTQLEDVKNQRECFQVIRIILYILGSLFIIYGKFFSIKKQ